MLIECPYFSAPVDLRDERRAHIEPNHPELLPAHFDRLVAAVSDPKPSDRHWIVTAFVARKPPRGEVEWKRP